MTYQKIKAQFLLRKCGSIVKGLPEWARFMQDDALEAGHQQDGQKSEEAAPTDDDDDEYDKVMHEELWTRVMHDDEARHQQDEQESKEAATTDEEQSKVVIASASSFKVFENNKHCSGQSAAAATCQSIVRTIHVLKKYELVCSKQSSEGPAMFIQFIQDKYPHFLDDSIHLTTVHDHDLETIFKSLRSKYNLRTCDTQTCTIGARHSSVERKLQYNEEPAFRFYQMHFDSLHYYLMHCFEDGFRLLSADIEHIIKSSPRSRARSMNKFATHVLEKQLATNIYHSVSSFYIYDRFNQLRCVHFWYRQLYPLGHCVRESRRSQAGGKVEGLSV